MNRERYLLISAIVFTLVALAHLARIVLGWDAVIDGWSVPMAMSWGAAAVTGGLAYSGFVLRRRSP